MQLPATEEVGATLSRLGFTERDAAVVATNLPSQAGQPEVWALLEEAHRYVVDNMGVPGELKLPRPVGLRGYDELFGIYVYLAALPDTRRWHAAHGIPDDVSWATLADLGRQVDTFYRFQGRVGFDEEGWLSLHFRGLLFQLGRLQFERSGIPEDWPAVGGVGPGDPALEIHIPEAGPLRPDWCDESLARAPGFFAKHLAGPSYRVGMCTSWLLDPQLVDYLPAGSNIVQFQRRFTLLPDPRESDATFIRFVFRSNTTDLAELPQTTTLERAVVGHMVDGRHWRVPSGWLSLPGSRP